MNLPRLAVIGCGAISRLAHLPALVRHPGMREHLVLVDRSPEQAREVSEEFEVRRVTTDHGAVIDEVDGAIIAVPPKYHAEIALDFIRRGKPVFVEKPLAMSAGEAEEMVQAAEGAGVSVAVNNNRRLLPSLRMTRDLVQDGRLGGLQRIEWYEGAPFGWPLASGGLFGRAGAGRGVLQDLGSHVLDTLAWWLGGTPTVRNYLDDSMGGTEAMCRLEFEYRGCEGVLQLSWLSNLSDQFRIEGEDGHLRGDIRAWDHITLRDPRGRTRKLKLNRELPNPQALRNRMMDNFLEVISNGAKPIVPAREVLPSLNLMDTCYRRRAQFEMPWMTTEGVEYAFG